MLSLENFQILLSPTKIKNPLSSNLWTYKVQLEQLIDSNSVKEYLNKSLRRTSTKN